MPLAMTGVLFRRDNRSGQSMFVGMGTKDRYNGIRPYLLQSRGLYPTIESVELFGTSFCDSNIVLLKNGDFSGSFAQVSLARSTGTTWWDTWGTIHSTLLIGSARWRNREIRFSFRDRFYDRWVEFLDRRLAGSRASREGGPTLTWEMLPDNVAHLDSRLAYLKVFQPLHISMPWYWADYAASMTYHIYLYVTGDGKIRAHGARWAYWVESGAKAGRIGSELGPQVRDGLGTLQQELNATLRSFDDLVRATDVYLLPGYQVSPIGTAGMTGNTIDDVTIVIEYAR